MIFFLSLGRSQHVNGISNLASKEVYTCMYLCMCIYRRATNDLSPGDPTGLQGLQHVRQTGKAVFQCFAVGRTLRIRLIVD